MVVAFHDPLLYPFVYLQLVSNERPIRNPATLPLLLQLIDQQEQKLEQLVLIGEITLVCYLTEAGIHTLHRVRCVHDLADRASVIE